MTVDMTKAVKGATVHFRCGGSAVVLAQLPAWSTGPSVRIVWNENSFNLYTDKGKCIGGEELHLLDIIRIDAPGFDWASAQRGQAFHSPATGTIHFIGYMLKGGKAVFETSGSMSWSCDIAWLKHLDRAPDHDIEVPE